MSKINVLAVLVTESVSIPIDGKAKLKGLLETSNELVRFVPIDVPGTPATETARGRADKIPAGVPVTVLSPAKGRQWSATVTRSGSNVFTVR